MLTAIKNTYWMLNGIMTGGSAISSFREISSIAQGETDFLAFIQSQRVCSLVHECFYILNEVYHYDISKSRQKWTALTIGYSIPFALQMANHRIDAKQYPLLKKSIVYLRDHLDHLMLIADIALTGMHAYNMSPLSGIGMAIGFTIEVLDETKVLPAKVKAVWEKTRIGLALISIMNAGFLFEGLFTYHNYVYFAGLIGTFVWEQYFERNPPPAEVVHRLSYDKAVKLHSENQMFKLISADGALNALVDDKERRLLDDPQKFQVNWAHVNFDPKLVSTGAADIGIRVTMQVLINKVVWNAGNLNVFRAKLLSDARFQKAHPEMKVEEDIPLETVQKIFIERAGLLATEIADSRIAKGDSFIRYDLLQAMLKSILKNLNESENFEGDLFKLAVEGGDYCAAGKVEVIEEVYKRRVLGRGNIPLQTKFLYQLNVMRMRWFESIYSRLALYSNKLPKGIIDPLDVHFHNLALFYFDKIFKLHNETIKNDMTLMTSGLCDYFYRNIFSLVANYTFWPYAMKSDSWYSATAIAQEIAEVSFSLGISGKEVADWWNGWFENQSEEIKEELKDNLLMEGKVLKKLLYVPVSPNNPKDNRQMINPVLVRLMLLDMGILQEKP